MALNIPQLILQFIENHIETDTMLLPFHYPKKNEWEEFQSGFRYHGLSGKDLTSTKEGEWQPGWYVIALNEMDDPFFIDLNEEASGFPVYYALHGAGRWDAIALGFDIASFGRFLEQMEKAGKDKTACLQLVELSTDIQNPFWLELRTTIQEWDDEETENTEIDPALLRYGKLVVTDAGPNKVKVAKYLMKIWEISPQEALARLTQPDVLVAIGFVLHLQKYNDDLQQLGAKVAWSDLPL
ncbi:hypothetical protein SAMN04488505_107259 [Chitinophaga rupis]|uniref:SMI1 / KNR4 family (SUKH-1) n=1 Tax=Chitinophaga rupis TaxID=573321 RepID=A0A1H8CXN5_9BACT|nr:SMI1/KNR4 family protein [Chitinophaga rupis]SEM99863.1 hypothetical protein SAMN04488505_107259 [Chitinophaga rupis]